MNFFSYYKQLFLLSVVIVFMNCNKENSENFVIDNLYVDTNLAPYFERFVEEGTQRGLNIDLDAKKIEGYIINIEGNNVVGQCAYSATSTRKVNIDAAYWAQASDLEKEFVVFHELGHCYLDRSHLDSQSNRTCTSIMHSGTTNCRFRYTTANRSAYLDELFNY